MANLLLELQQRQPVNLLDELEQQKPTEPRLAMLQTIASIMSGAAAEPLAGLSGIAGLAAGAIAPGGETGGEKAKRFVEGTREALTFQGGERSQEQLQGIGEVLTPAIEKFEAAEDFLGDTALEATDSPAFAAFAKSLPTAALEAIPGGLAIRQARTAAKTAKQTQRALPAPTQATDIVEGGNFLTRVLTGQQSPVKQRIAKLIQEGSTDIETAKFKLVENAGKGQRKIEADPVAKATITQGFDEGVIAAIKGAGSTDKSKMLQMLDVMQKVKKNRKFGMTNRPSDIAGTTLMDRFRRVRAANKNAGKQLDTVANNLKGKEVDVSSAVNEFGAALEDMGVKITGDLKPDFSGAIIEGSTGAENLLNKVVKRMRSAKPLDAFEAHRMKRFLDEQVTFGKSAEGLTGTAEVAVKRFRHNLDTALDTTFPAYDKVNTVYAETIGAIDSLQDVAGKKMNLRGPNADKAVGTLLRRLMSNAQSRVTLLDSANQIDSVAQKHGFIPSKSKELAVIPEGGSPPSSAVPKGPKDDLMTQILFADELDRVFGPVARTSFQGQIIQGTETALRGKAGLAEAAVKGTIKKVLNVNDEQAFKTMRDLLRR